MHELDFNLTCGVCGKTGIRNKAYLQQHMYRNHSGEMKCEKCNFTTTVKLQMKRHMQVGTFDTFFHGPVCILEDMNEADLACIFSAVKLAF